MTPKKLLALPVLLFLVSYAHAQHKLGLAPNDTLECTYLKDNSFQVSFTKISGKDITSKPRTFSYNDLVPKQDSVKKFLIAQKVFADGDTVLLNSNITAITDTIKAAYNDYWISQLKLTVTPDSATIVLLKTPATTVLLSALRSKDAGDAPTINVYKNGELFKTTRDVTKNSSKAIFTNTYKSITPAQADGGVGYNDSLGMACYTDTVYGIVIPYFAQNIGLKSKYAPNFDSLTYNDSLRGHLTMFKRVAVYEADSDGTRFNPTGDSLTLLTGQLYINEGYLYNIAFTVSPADAKRFLIAPGQAFAKKINLRNSLFAGFMINRSGEVKKFSLNIPPDHYNSQVRRDESKLNVLPLETDYRKYPYIKSKIDTLHRYVIFPGDVVRFDPPRRAPNPIFTAKEMMYSYADTDDLWNKPIPVKEKSLYAFINLDVYSDLIGLFDENKPNGLLQTELRVMFRGFRKPVWQKYASRARITPLDKGEFYVRASKLDAKNKFLPVLHAGDSSMGTKYVHAFNLLQYKSLVMGIRVNLLNIEYRGGSAALVGEASFIRTPLRDTLTATGANNTITKTPVELGINSRLLAPGINLKFNVASFLDVDFLGRAIWLKEQGNTNIMLSKKEYSDVYANSYEAIPSGERWLVNYKGTVTINLDDDKTKRIILTVEKTREWKQEGNNFWQAQVGYSADLNKFLNFNSDKKEKKD